MSGTTHFGHILAAERTLGLAAQNPHPGAAFEAHGVVTGANRVDVHVTEAHAARILQVRVVGRGSRFASHT